MHVLVRRGRSCHMTYKCLFIALKFSLFCFYNSIFGLLMTLCIVTITVLYFIAFRLLKKHNYCYFNAADDYYKR